MATSLIICTTTLFISTWIVAAGLALEEGHKKTAVLLAVTGLVLPPVNWVYLVQKERHRRAPWIAKFFWIEVISLLIAGALFSALWLAGARLR
ncbi:MAG: hypothetical protein LBV61_11420 [Burkholderiaceae bacterium]|nr:hypothetical protein [Burkholderiaceae bacterium]